MDRGEEKKEVSSKRRTFPSRTRELNGSIFDIGYCLMGTPKSLWMMAFSLLSCLLPVDYPPSFGAKLHMFIFYLISNRAKGAWISYKMEECHT